MLEFLVEVARRSAENKMDLSNLAKCVSWAQLGRSAADRERRVFGPSLMRGEKDSALQMLEDARYVMSTVRLLLEEFDYVFGVRLRRVTIGTASHAVGSGPTLPSYPPARNRRARAPPFRPRSRRTSAKRSASQR